MAKTPEEWLKECDPAKRPAVFKDKVSSDMPDYFPWWDEREYE